MTRLLKINDTVNVIPAGFTAIYSGRSTGDSGQSRAAGFVVSSIRS
jgi:hypothetical protein